MRWRGPRVLMVMTLGLMLGLAGCQQAGRQPMSQGPPGGMSGPEPVTIGADRPTGTGAPGQGPAGQAGPPASPPAAQSDSNAPAAESGAPPERMTMPPAGSPAPQGPRSYTIQEGDTLYSLAQRFYGDGQQWQRITDANPNLDPQRMRVGQEIIIPRQ